MSSVSFRGLDDGNEHPRDGFPFERQRAFECDVCGEWHLRREAHMVTDYDGGSDVAPMYFMCDQCYQKHIASKQMSSEIAETQFSEAIRIFAEQLRKSNKERDDEGKI